VIVLVLAAIGYAVSLLLTLIGYFRDLSDPVPLYVLFGGIFITFGAAVLTHPRSTSSGGHTNVGWGAIFRTAPVWSIVAFGVSVAVFLFNVVGSGPDEFQMNAAAFAGRPDRYRFVTSFFLVFYGCALLVKASGLEAHRRVFLP
jgi:hypothetical protein